MWAMLFPVLAGIACVILGITNMRGNISTIHAYHRKRVKEEDALPFGRKVGLGTIFVGASVAIFGVLSMIASYSRLQILLWIGYGVIGLGLISGLSLSLYAIIKYNKGLF